MPTMSLCLSCWHMQLHDTCWSGSLEKPFRVYAVVRFTP